MLGIRASLINKSRYSTVVVFQHVVWKFSKLEITFIGKLFRNKMEKFWKGSSFPRSLVPLGEDIEAERVRLELENEVLGTHELVREGVEEVRPPSADPMKQ